MSKIVTFASPVDASHYQAAGATAKGAALHSLDYDTGELRFSLVAEDDSVAPEICGITQATPAEATAAADIRAAIAATIPA